MGSAVSPHGVHGTRPLRPVGHHSYCADQTCQVRTKHAASSLPGSHSTYPWARDTENIFERAIKGIKQSGASGKYVPLMTGLPITESKQVNPEGARARTPEIMRSCVRPTKVQSGELAARELRLPRRGVAEAGCEISCAIDSYSAAMEA